MYIKEMKPNELEYFLNHARTIGSGYFGRVLDLNDGDLVKVDKRLYRAVNPDYGDIYIPIKELKKYNFYSHIDVNQIYYFSNVSKSIKHTKLPKGLLVCSNIPVGIILHNHINHVNLGDLTHVRKIELEHTNKDYITLYKEKNKMLVQSLKRLILCLKELEQHKISQNDLTYNYNSNREFNVLVKDSIPQIIDLDSSFVKYGNNYEDARYMYMEYARIIDILDEIYNLRLSSSIKTSDISTYYNVEELYKEFKSKMKEKRLF